MSKKVNPLLVEERETATFDRDLMTYFIDGGREKTEQRRRIEALVVNDPDFQHPPISFLSREEQYDLAVKKACLCIQKLREYDITDPYECWYFRKTASPRETMPLSLHDLMFIPTILGQGNDEQQEEWLTRAAEYKILGTYAQTEMGHGTFLRGVETTATFDQETQEFILNSPSVTSLKWWPGGLGKSSNCAIVAAQLYTKGVCYGIHMFILQLRDFKTHESLPGIVLGDIGPKMGFQSVDNGFMQLKQVRVPLRNMLMRSAQVKSDGSYVRRAKSDKLTYGSMVLIRSLLVSDMALGLGEAVTIAIRYSAIRLQGVIDESSQEVKILDYPTQQYKLTPLLAASYALRLTGDMLREWYLSIQGDLFDGNVEVLPELHGLSSGLKAVSSWIASRGIEQCRMACGGHGYSMASGLFKIFADLAPACTYEGENTVLMLQAGRYLLKCVEQSRVNQDRAASVAYITSNPITPVRLTQFDSIPAFLEAYELRSLKMIQEVDSRLQKRVLSGTSWDMAFQQVSIPLVTAAQAHIEFYICRRFDDVTSTADVSLQTVLKDLVLLHLLIGIVDNSGGFFAAGSLCSSEDLAQCQTSLEACMTRLRPNLVMLVDALDVQDRILGSVLGRYDGRVYEALFEWARESPLNTTDVHSSYYKYIRPLMNNEAIQIKDELRQARPKL